jgi:hypothetical protein
VPHRIPRKAFSWLLRIDPFLASIFYIGFVMVAVFIVIVYARHITNQVDEIRAEQDDKIVIATVSACRRTNEVRRAVNARDRATNEILDTLLARGVITKDEVEDFQEELDGNFPVRVPNCVREIGSITGIILREFESNPEN